MLLTTTIVYAFLVTWPGNTEAVNGWMYPELYHAQSELGCEVLRAPQLQRQEALRRSIGRPYMEVSPCRAVELQALRSQFHADRWVWVTGVDLDRAWRRP